MENLTHEPSACKIRRFEMMKYSFEADKEYVAIKEHEHINHLETNMDARHAYRELFRKMDDEWLDLAANEIDLMIYSEKCQVLNSHGHSKALIKTPYAQTLKMENHPE
ncbi:hypothetical protein Tco_0886742 [Tanacetum coccineum]